MQNIASGLSDQNQYDIFFSRSQSVDRSHLTMTIEVSISAVKELVTHVQPSIIESFFTWHNEHGV